MIAASLGKRFERVSLFWPTFKEAIQASISKHPHQHDSSLDSIQQRGSPIPRLTVTSGT